MKSIHKKPALSNVLTSLSDRMAAVHEVKAKGSMEQGQARKRFPSKPVCFKQHVGRPRKLYE